MQLCDLQYCEKDRQVLLCVHGRWWCWLPFNQVRSCCQQIGSMRQNSLLLLSAHGGTHGEFCDTWVTTALHGNVCCSSPCRGLTKLGALGGTASFIAVRVCNINHDMHMCHVSSDSGVLCLCVYT
jgi:hypothetical protein